MKRDWDDEEDNWSDEESWQDGDDGSDKDDAWDETEPCSHCGEPIHEEAQQCPHCGTYISEEDSLPPRRPLWVMVGLVICLLIAIFWALGSL